MSMIAELMLKALLKVPRKLDIPTGQFTPIETILREHRTIHLGLPRQTGKSTAVGMLAMSEPSLVICRNVQMCRSFSSTWPSVSVLPLNQMPLHPMKTIFRQPISILLLDECLHATEAELQPVFNLAGRLWEDGQVDRESFVIAIVGT